MFEKDQAQSHKTFARQRKDQQRGILIHETHQMLSHFDLLKPIFSHADNILWSLDNDSGLANAFASVLLEDLKSNKMCALLLSSKERDIAAIEHQQIQDTIDRLQLVEAPKVKLASLWYTQSLPLSNVNYW